MSLKADDGRCGCSSKRTLFGRQLVETELLALSIHSLLAQAVLDINLEEVRRLRDCLRPALAHVFVATLTRRLLAHRESSKVRGITG